MVGFNRRFSLFAAELARELVSLRPLVMHYTVNASAARTSGSRGPPASSARSEARRSSATAFSTSPCCAALHARRKLAVPSSG